KTSGGCTATMTGSAQVSIDTTPPTIGGQGANATIDCTTTPSFTQPTASDAVSGATVNIVGGSTTGNSCTRVYTRSWDATDACGNHSGTVTQTITAVDTHAPTIDAAAANSTIDCTARSERASRRARDDCRGATVNIEEGTTTGN